MNNKFILSGIALVAAFGAGVVSSNFVVAQANLVVAKEAVRDDLADLAGKEVIAQYFEYKPGASIPWHQHPEGHEVSVVVEGTTVLEVEGQPKRMLNVGDGFHLQPGVVHRGGNESGAPAKVVTIRIKSKDQPIMVPVQR